MATRNIFRLILILFSFLLTFSSVSSGSDFRAGERLVIAEGQVIDDDIYFAGDSIIVDGIINGDLIAAGSSITVSGVINGSLTAVAGTISVTGTVTNDIRAAGGDITISGNVGDNAIVFAGDLLLEKDANIARDLTIGVSSAVIDGTVNGDINGGSGDVELSGVTKGNVTLEVENKLKVLPDAKIGKDLKYTAPEPAEISGTVSGNINYSEKVTREKKEDTSSIEWEMITYLWLLLMGILILTLFPEVSQKVSDNVSINPLKNLLWGILFLIVTPVIGFLFLITVIGIPVSLILLVVYLLKIYVSRIFIGLWVGHYVLKILNKEIKSRVLTLAIGLLVVFIGINLPVLGSFIHLIIILLGIGAIILTLYEVYKKLKEQKSI